MLEGHSAPFEYLCHSFFEGVGDELSDSPISDAVVWASRGGGKTYLGAVATLLDLLFKPGVQVRILGGSFEQSSKMYRYLRRMVERPLLRGVVAGRPTQRVIELVNGSRVEVLSQSQQSVRGQRVHKMRCDEVEEFKPDIWEAAQLVTQSGVCGGVHVRGTVEAMSTMHRPFGVMSRLVGKVLSGEKQRRRLFRWCALDVIERCPSDRDCGVCVLWDDCQGRAKRAEGFVAVDDLVTQWHRSSGDAWASEMMCKQPRRSDSVYPSFDSARGGRHVAAVPVAVDHAEAGGASIRDGVVIGGMDFGLRSPLVMLWARVRPLPPEEGRLPGRQSPCVSGGGVVEVFGEYQEHDIPLDQHLDAIGSAGLPEPVWVGVDPAGASRNSQTGLSDVQVLRRRGYAVRVVRAGVRDGIECVRRRLDHGTLVISPNCERLIEALATYHFDAANPERDDPVKDGPDHLCDALRYMIVSLDLGSRPVITRRY